MARRKHIAPGALLFKIFSMLFLICGVIMILFPFYIVIITAFKTQAESAANFFAMPSSWTPDNFISVISKANYFMYFGNSALITVSSIILIFLLIPMCAYAIARNMNSRKYFKFIFYFLMLAIFVPFQVIMVPMVLYMGWWHLNIQVGLIIMHVVFASAQGVYLMTNYIRSVPPDLEESASIDGCTTWGSYWRVVLPLVKPMIATILVLNALWVWNDFQMPLLILNTSPNTWTLPLFQYNFKTQYSYDYNLAFASYLIAMVPVMIAYAFAQKYIVEGLTAGAVKT